MFSLNDCPICGHVLSAHFTTTDFSVSRESFTLKRCEFCSLLVTDPQPDKDQLGKYYESVNYVSHTSKANSLINALYLAVRKFTLRKKINLVERYSATGKILDVGCGTGNFLAICKTRGWKVQGVEPSSIARREATKVTMAINETLEENKESNFDAITLWHVLEHLPDLNSSVALLKDKIAENGTIFIAVPNYESHDANYYKEYWAGYDVPRHLWHFTRKSMTMLLEKNGLKLQEIKPMKFDAFYVSLLSEKYKGVSGHHQFLNALKNGLESNRRAQKNDNFSSLIYIVKK